MMPKSRLNGSHHAADTAWRFREGRETQVLKKARGRA